MWERMAEPARRATFFALWYARIAECAKTDSVDLLKGLMYEEAFRANTIFGLREHFPHRCNCPCKFVTSEEVPKYTPALTDDFKRILARTAAEADAMRDYWIDTEHLLLGIMAEQGCPAAQYLAKAGLTLKTARRAVIENQSSRPDYGPVPQMWSIQSPWERLVGKWRMRRYTSG
jgi:ATP-dependent Clp protease ATP-binding subunit ClpA